jgi:hypothetical protein
MFALDFKVIDRELLQARFDERRLFWDRELNGASRDAVVGIALNALGGVQKVLVR